MRMDWSFLKTRVARRIFFLFFACALVPIIGAAGYSYWHVSNELRRQSQTRLQETVRATDGAILERLRFLDTELRNLAMDLGRQQGLRLTLPPDDPDSPRSTRFRALVFESGGSPRLLFGQSAHVPDSGTFDVNHIASGRSLLIAGAGSPEPAIFMGRLVDQASPGGGVLWARLDPRYLFGAGPDHPGLPSGMVVCVLDHMAAPLYCPVDSTPITAQLASTSTDRGEFRWTAGDDHYAAGFKSLFLRYSYGSPDWILVLSESEAAILEPMAGFTKIFPFAILLVLLVVFQVSNLQIKKSMDPLVRLKEGTQRIAKRDFGNPVEVQSGDEFEDLASSFNSMAGRLRSQFATLTALNEIDHVVLSAQSVDSIIDTVLTGTRQALPCDGLSVSLLSGIGRGAKWRLVAVAARDDEQIRHDIEISAEEEQELRRNQNHLIISGGPGSRSYLVISPFTTGGISSFLVLPIFLKGELTAVIALGYVSRPEFSEEDLSQARQMADQVAVALSNTRLIDELDALNVGALTALARTIDAKSPWTAGHSERVTRTSLRVARKLGLGEEELEVINRGGLLHDIGKIGIPAEILDKPAALNEAEMQVMRDHVTVGARILEPIAAYADVIPIVLRHHERYDGSGYPDGVAGEEIEFHARVLAAGDVYDALTSHRPYRSGMRHADAVAWIVEQSGSHFDPEVVKAFVAAMSEPEVRSGDTPVPVYRPATSLAELS